MEWVKIKKYQSDGVIICRNEDIDYLSSVHDDVVTLHLKNGEYYHVESGGLFELLRHVEKIEKNTLYGMTAVEYQNRDDEIQDLKLENDRLQKRNDYMYDFIYSLSKAGLKWTSVRADMIIKKLEDL